MKLREELKAKSQSEDEHLEKLMKGRFEKTSRSRMIGKAKEELRLGRLNRRKKLVII